MIFTAARVKGVGTPEEPAVGQEVQMATGCPRPAPGKAQAAANILPPTTQGWRCAPRGSLASRSGCTNMDGRIGKGGPEATGGLVSAGHALRVALGPPPGPFTSQALLDPAKPLGIEQPGLVVFHLKPSGPPSPHRVAPALGHCYNVLERAHLCPCSRTGNGLGRRATTRWECWSWHGLRDLA